MRAGAHFLLMGANPVNRGILRLLLEGTLELPPGQRHLAGPGGREMLFIAFVIERWLQSAPRGPIPFDSAKAEIAVKALAEGWSETLVHTLAREPLVFEELHRSIDGLSREALERLLAAMRRVGLVEARPEEGEGAIYAATDWLRAGIAPLIAAARLERRNPMESIAPIDALDVEAGFLLSLPLLELPIELSGVCRLGVNLADDMSERLTGVTATIDQGRIVACEAGLEAKADASAAASASDWLDTVIEPDVKRVKAGGDRWLTRAVLDALHKTLFGIPVL